jgi:hypothetical protein
LGAKKIKLFKTDINQQLLSPPWTTPLLATTSMLISLNFDSLRIALYFLLKSKPY